MQQANYNTHTSCSTIIMGVLYVVVSLVGVLCLLILLKQFRNMLKRWSCTKLKPQAVLVPLLRGAEAELTVEAKEKRRVTSVSLDAGSEVKGRDGLVVSLVNKKTGWSGQMRNRRLITKTY